MCHWIATNITLPSPSIRRRDFLPPLLPFTIFRESGVQEVMSYFPPAPPPGTGYHRYVFVLLMPANRNTKVNGLKKPKERQHWGYGKIGAGVREWAEDNMLVPAGRLGNHLALMQWARRVLTKPRLEFFLCSKQKAMNRWDMRARW